MFRLQYLYVAQDCWEVSLPTVYVVSEDPDILHRTPMIVNQNLGKSCNGTIFPFVNPLMAMAFALSQVSKTVSDWVAMLVTCAGEAEAKCRCGS